MKAMLVAGLAVALLTIGAVQFEKMTPEDQGFVRAVPANLENAYALMFTTGVFRPDGINHNWLYFHTDQAMGYDRPDSNTPDAICDTARPPTEQSQNCRSLISYGDVHEFTTHAAVVSVTAEAAESYRIRGRYTSFTQKDRPLPKAIRHIWATHCEKPDDPIFAMLDMETHLENMRVALHPSYQQDILWHLKNGMHDGRKIHPRGVHPDCKLEG